MTTQIGIIMTVLKLSSNKKSIQVIDDDGNMYVTSVNFVIGLINGKSPKGFITTTRLLNKVAPDRFKPSEVFDPHGLLKNPNTAKTLDTNNLTTNSDVFSVKARQETENSKAFVDKKVW